jgi:hypothetical protein
LRHQQKKRGRGLEIVCHARGTSRLKYA